METLLGKIAVERYFYDQVPVIIASLAGDRQPGGRTAATGNREPCWVNRVVAPCTGGYRYRESWLTIFQTCGTCYNMGSNKVCKTRRLSGARDLPS
jgi:hypothetical protein